MELFTLGQGKQSHEIEKSLVERDLGLLVSSDIKWANQVEKATKAAKAIIAQIRNSFSYFDSELVKGYIWSLQYQYGTHI